MNLSGNNITDVSPLAAAAHIKSVNLAGNKLTSVLGRLHFVTLCDGRSSEAAHPLSLQTSSPSPCKTTLKTMSSGFALDLHWMMLTCPTTVLRSSTTYLNTGASCCIRVCVRICTGRLFAHITCPQCRFLRRLILANNQIRRMTGLGSLSHLQTLDLSNNRIERIEGIDNLPLKTLNLEGNQLTRIRNMHTLTQLQVLSVARNQIQSLTGLQVWSSFPLHCGVCLRLVLRHRNAKH